MNWKGPTEKAVKDRSDRWLLTYADLITLLLAFFVVLYSTSSQDLARFQSIAQSLRQAFNAGVLNEENGPSPITSSLTGRELDQTLSQGQAFTVISQSLGRYAKEQGFTGQVSVRTEQDQVIVSLSDPLLFDSASADLKPESTGVLNAVAVLLKDMPNQVRIEGHTDDIPINTELFNSNWELSTARATAVLRFLVEQGGLDPRRIYAAGYAQYKPRLPNDAPQNRALNRRADIVILFPQQEGKP